jgi:xylulokinase
LAISSEQGLGSSVVRVTSTEGAAFGAALLAGVAGGAWPDVDAACDATIAVTGREQPDETTRAVYEERHAQFRALYPALRGHMRALGGGPR